MPYLLQLAQSYNDPESVTYRLAYLREQMEQDKLNLGEMAYQDQVQLAMLGETIQIGGYIRTELLDAKMLRIGDESTNVFAYKDGIIVNNGNITVKDANNKSVITSNGLKMKYVFVSSGKMNGWEFAGTKLDIDGWINPETVLFVYIPSEFIIESAILHTKAMPTRLENDEYGAPDGFYHARQLNLYKVDDDADVHVFVYDGHMYESPVTGSKTNITNDIWGSAWNPTGNKVQIKSASVKDVLAIGGRTLLAVKSNIAGSSANARYASALQMELEITGFLRG